MALRLSLILLLLVLAFVVESSPFDAGWALTHFTRGARRGSGGLSTSNTCGGLVGDCIDEEDEMMMDSEANRRSLARARRWISYDALKKNKVPCSRRGLSYYGCSRASRVNPYRRGCSRITHCQRYLR